MMLPLQKGGISLCCCPLSGLLGRRGWLCHRTSEDVSEDRWFPMPVFIVLTLGFEWRSGLEFGCAGMGWGVNRKDILLFEYWCGGTADENAQIVNQEYTAVN